jgi:hypothetical protein
MSEVKDRHEFLCENTLRNRSRSTCTPVIREARMSVEFEALVPRLVDASVKLDKKPVQALQERLIFQMPRADNGKINNRQAREACRALRSTT